MHETKEMNYTFIFYIIAPLTYILNIMLYVYIEENNTFLLYFFLQLNFLSCTQFKQNNQCMYAAVAAAAAAKHNKKGIIKINIM